MIPTRDIMKHAFASNTYSMHNTAGETFSGFTKTK
jgi:hypothetical protein